MKEELLSNARNIFLFNSQVAGLDAQTLNAYHDVLGLFIEFTGNIFVEDLTPDHVRLYINNLSDGPSEGDEHTRTVISHYAVIHEWIRWLYAQKFATERIPGEVKSNMRDLFPVPSSKKILTYCA
jgi:hypothetical protein